VGRITRVERDGERALVTAILFEPRVFRLDTRFRNISPDIMGDRELAIEPGREGQVAPKDFVFTGEFEPGLAEILRLVDMLQHYVKLVMDITRFLQFGTDSTPSLNGQIQTILSVAESTIDTLTRTVARLDKTANRALRGLDGYTREASRAAVQVGKTLDTLRTVAHASIDDAQAILERADTLIVALSSAVAQVREHPLTHELLHSRALVDDIEGLIATLDGIVSRIDNKGIVMLDSNGERISMIRFKNLHLLRERAASKAKKREKLGITLQEAN
jgi:hypothetical protein